MAARSIHADVPPDSRDRHDTTAGAIGGPVVQLHLRPTGTGTAARLAVLGTDGSLGEGEQLQTESLTGSKFTGTVVRREQVGSYEGVKISLTGRAWTLARSELVVDFSDPMVSADGFSDLLTRR